MSAAEALSRIVAALDAAGIPRMLAGSHASSLHGTPRTTQDFDLVIDPSEESLRTLVRSLPGEGWYVSEAAAEEALRRRTMFNVIDERTGWKFDLVLLRRDDFSLSEWERREPREVQGIRIDVATAEDTIVAKLDWARRMGGSERQLRDVSGIVEVSGGDLDREYVERWVGKLGLRDFWDRVTGRTG